MVLLGTQGIAIAMPRRNNDAVKFLQLQRAI